jgi:multisubunit Na+/H+ antiporter MnhC subunit
LVKVPEVPERPGWRDYFQIVTTGLMVVIGFYILWQTIFVRWAIASLIFGIALLLFSLYRARMIWTYFQQRGRRNGI